MSPLMPLPQLINFCRDLAVVKELLGLGLAGLSPKAFRQDSLWTLDRFDQAIVAGVTACLFAFGAWVTFRVALALTR